MKLKADQQRVMDYLHRHSGDARGMALGKGKPHDRRTLQSLIDCNRILPIFRKDDPLHDEFAIREVEDCNGLALFRDNGHVIGATHYDVPVRRFSDEDYAKDESGDALQNGIDTAWELYPYDEDRREWMQWAIAQSTLSAGD